MQMDERERKELGETIRDFRGKRGWTQDELAEHAGVSVRTVGNLERGAVVSQAGVLGKVLDTLGIQRPEDPWAGDVMFEGFLKAVGLTVWNADPDEQARLIIEVYRLLMPGPMNGPSGLSENTQPA